ncbi:MAG: response regulator transcription factor [Bacteroidia bacterium]|nr:response regulator transcription factor [Bacteroidia bacterium]
MKTKQKMSDKIVLIDDEEDILEFLSYNLKKEGYQVITHTNAKAGIDAARKFDPDLIVLDIMMPEMDGIEACRIIREDNVLKNKMVVFLTARNEDYTQIAGFDVGADDFITKPIKPRVFVSRIKALLRRKNQTVPDTSGVPSNLIFGELTIDTEKHLVYLGENEIQLPRKEFNLLVYLASKPGKVFTREQIFENIWGDDVIVGDRTIDVHIRKLREKLGDKYIKTVKGVGYKFDF